MNKFLSVVFQQFTHNTDERIIKKTAEVFGRLLRLGGSKIAQVIESDTIEALKWLRAEVLKESRKLAALLALKTLLIEAPQITFSKIFNREGSCFSLIWNIIR